MGPARAGAGVAGHALAKSGWPGLFRYRRMLGLCGLFLRQPAPLLFAQVYVGWSATLLIEELKRAPLRAGGFFCLALLCSP